MEKRKKEDDCFQQNGKYCITVYFGAREDRYTRYVITASSYGEAIQKIVNDYMKDYPEGLDQDSEIRFIREVFTELK